MPRHDGRVLRERGRPVRQLHCEGEDLVPGEEGEVCVGGFGAD